MGILRYIPKKREVIDRRSDNGGYYEAMCNECGNAFYPKRSNAMYCSRSCTVMAYRKHREAKKLQALVPEFKLVVPALEKPAKEVFSNRDSLVMYLKDNYKSVIGSIGDLREALKVMDIGSKLDFDKVTVKRISLSKYSV